MQPRNATEESNAFRLSKWGNRLINGEVMQENIKLDFLKAKRALFDKVYAQGLNSEQRRAVFTTKGPVLVLAGAGSGKTTVLVNRIAYIIKFGNAYFSNRIPDGVDSDTVEALSAAYELPPDEIEDILPQFIENSCPPWQVLAFTFTNKAAGEIKERLLATFEDKTVAESIWAGTFHSVCLRILRKYGDRLGYQQGFSIYDTDDQKRMVADCMKTLNIDEKRLAPKAALNAISRAKDKLQSPDEMDTEGDPRGKDLIAIYELYEREMLRNNAVDFDDIIKRTVELLTEFDDIRSYYQRKFKYVLVDEYQDTNYAQFILTKLLSDGTRNIMVVGDDDQSIYRFRGATVENILNFDKTYPDATVVKLEQNYRSTENILAAANAVIGNNKDRHSKRLWCDKGEGDKIIIKESEDQFGEGRYIIERITKSVIEEKRKYSDFAVLYRVNALGRTLQTSFAKSGIPYRIIGDMGFYDRKEVKDMIAYLSVVASTGDNLRLKRIINEPKRKIGSATVDAVEQIATMNGLSMYGVLERVNEYTVLSKSAEKLRGFVELIEDIRANATIPSELIKYIFDRSGYREMLKAEGREGETKIEHVMELVSAAMEYEARMSDNDQEPTLLGFLEEVFLISDVDKYDDDADAVVLMTIHAAKGLEFPIVFLAGMEDGIFPSEQNRSEEAEMSEERRLCYVAITRAKDRLYVTYAKSRMMYGRTVFGRLSCFVREEVPKSLIVFDTPRREPPRQSAYGGYTRPGTRPADSRVSSEFSRAPGVKTSAQPPKKTGAAGFGVEKLTPGTRVKHASFGVGVILSAKDMGGDMLYEVKFDSVGVKRLMATFAKLEKI